MTLGGQPVARSVPAPSRPAIEHASGLRVGFLAAEDPDDIQSWSGTLWRMKNALEHEAVSVAVIKAPEPPIVGRIARRLDSAARHTLRRRYGYAHSRALAWSYGRDIGRRLAGVDVDVLFAPAASTQIASLTTDIPIVYTSDATFRLMVDYYPSFRDLLNISLREGDWIEGSAIRRAARLAYPSEWAARSAIVDYGAPASVVDVIAFGANLDEPPPAMDLGRRRGSPGLRLLFLGVDWERKGGQLAFETLRELRRRRLPAKLVVCGCAPPDGVTDPALTVIPYLDKRDPRDRRRLDRELWDADLLLLPTRQEALGIVFAEASAFGLPSVATRTGGVSAMVRDGENGYLLEPEAGPESYADVIEELTGDPSRYRDLAASSREAYEHRLNWRVWARAMAGVLAAATGRG